MELPFWSAPEALELARDIIPKHHDRLQGADIEYVFKSKATVGKTKVTLAKAKLIQGLNAFLAGRTEPFFCIEFGHDQWIMLEDFQKKALVDHELCHCGVDEDGELYMIDHDIEEFGAIVKRYGPWKGDVSRFLHAAAGVQLKIFDEFSQAPDEEEEEIQRENRGNESVIEAAHRFVETEGVTIGDIFPEDEAAAKDDGTDDDYPEEPGNYGGD